MNLIPRTSLTVYLKHIKHERQLRKYGHIVHTNKQERYVIIYINEVDADVIVHKLMQMKYVRHIDASPYKYLKKHMKRTRNAFNSIV